MRSSTFELGLTVTIVASFLYQEKISLTKKVLAKERKVQIKTSTSLKTSCFNLYPYSSDWYSSKIRNSSVMEPFAKEITSEFRA